MSTISTASRRSPYAPAICDAMKSVLDICSGDVYYSSSDLLAHFGHATDCSAFHSIDRELVFGDVSGFHILNSRYEAASRFTCLGPLCQPASFFSIDKGSLIYAGQKVYSRAPNLHFTSVKSCVVVYLLTM